MMRNRGFIRLNRFVIALAFVSASTVQGGELKLENQFVAWHGKSANGTLQATRLDDKINGRFLNLDGDCFQVTLGDGTVLKSSDFKLDGDPQVGLLKSDAASPTVALHFPGHEVVARFLAPGQHLSAEWHVILRDGSTYVRQQLVLHAESQDVLVKNIELFDQQVPNAYADGRVDGSPVVAKDFFFGYEHPMAQNTVDSNDVVHCRFLRNAVLKKGETLTQGCVLGVSPQGQLRRGFLAYIERERAHPYRPFLHYNSWFDIAWHTRKYTQAEALDAMSELDRELVQKRGVKLDSFLFDDGWDDNRTLWQFDQKNFPDGFTPLTEAAKKMDTSIGVWLSPFGGYSTARQQRLAFGVAQGYETNASGFALSGPKYYQRFHDICLEMIKQYGVNQFKFDGLRAGGQAAADGLTRDGDAMLNLIGDLRAAEPDIYINQTTGTWPSPFWLLYVDSTWRGGYDCNFYGQGTDRQRWITYRDRQTYRAVVEGGPLYPLNAIMLHGIIFATNASRLNTASDGDFRDEVREFFGTGTQLQELYITPALLNQQNWDDLAEAAKWARANADVLVDTHWIGGDPGLGEVYGWASWCPRRGIIVLRNPDSRPATFTADVAKLFELPPGPAQVFTMHSPWKSDRGQSSVKLRVGESHEFTLQPFEVLVFESK